MRPHSHLASRETEDRVVSSLPGAPRWQRKVVESFLSSMFTTGNMYVTLMPFPSLGHSPLGVTRQNNKHRLHHETSEPGQEAHVPGSRGSGPEVLRDRKEI